MNSQTRAVVPYSAEYVSLYYLQVTDFEPYDICRREYCDESRLTDHNASSRLAIITNTVTSDMNNEGPLGRWVGVIKTTISSPTVTVIAWWGAWATAAKNMVRAYGKRDSSNNGRT